MHRSNVVSLRQVTLPIAYSILIVVINRKTLQKIMQYERRVLSPQTGRADPGYFITESDSFRGLSEFSPNASSYVAEIYGKIPLLIPEDAKVWCCLSFQSQMLTPENLENSSASKN